MTTERSHGGDPNREVFAIEREAARACRDYHERFLIGPTFRDRRAALAEFAATFYQERLRVPLGARTRATMSLLADPDTLILEMAHDGQLPHLGITRLVLKAHDVASQDRQAVTLYLVGNHYTPAMRPDNIRFGMPLKGEPPDAVKHPPKIKIGKANAQTPFRWLPPPESDDLAALRDQVRDFVSNNLAHEAKVGQSPTVGAAETAEARLSSIFTLLQTTSRDVDSFGDWLVRVQHDLFERLLPGEADRILFLPMADLTDLFREDLATLGLAGSLLSGIKGEVSAEQASRGEEPYQHRAETSSFWFFCPTCHRRQRGPWSPGSPVELACTKCGREVVLDGADLWKRMMPDIVAYECGLFRLGIDGWIVGSRAAYHPVIERTYAHVFGMIMPPKFFLTSIPVFRGAGDPPEGYGKTRLLRALLEIEPEVLGQALRAPWGEDPFIRSDLLSEPQTGRAT